MRVVRHVNTSVTGGTSDMAMGDDTARTAMVSTSGYPSVVPILAILTTMDRKAAGVVGTKHLHVGRYSELTTVADRLGGVNTTVARRPRNLAVANGPRNLRNNMRTST